VVFFLSGFFFSSNLFGLSFATGFVPYFGNQTAIFFGVNIFLGIVAPDLLMAYRTFITSQQLLDAFVTRANTAQGDEQEINYIHLR
jgi:hypothetical protein